MYTTYQAAEHIRGRLRPYIEQADNIQRSASLEDLAAMYMERFGELTQKVAENK